MATRYGKQTVSEAPQLPKEVVESPTEDISKPIWMSTHLPVQPAVGSLLKQGVGLMISKYPFHPPQLCDSVILFNYFV